MYLWTVLVLGTVRLNCNWDYDKVHEIANNHITLRKMLGHGVKYGAHEIDDGETYALQRIKDNVSLLTPEQLDRISELVVKEGHKLLNRTNVENNENNDEKQLHVENVNENENENENEDEDEDEDDNQLDVENVDENAEKLHCKFDSYVIETDVHFPTDINLLYDAARVMIQLIAVLCDRLGISEWRQYVYHIGKIKNIFEW